MRIERLSRFQKLWDVYLKGMKQKEYKKLWDKDFTGNVDFPMPEYSEFEQCERMIQDYLDIFRGENTRVRGVEMPYEHPFFDLQGKPLLDSKPKIKFILIGEARPPKASIILNNCGPIRGDINNTFFYDIRDVKPSQPYLSSARINWGCPPFTPCPSNKKQTLLELARNGVLLLDIFPFSVPYGAIRNTLNNNGTTRSYWDDRTNPYNLHDRIDAISTLLDTDWDLTLVAPCLISEYIVNPLNAFPSIAVVPLGLHPAQFRSVLLDSTRCTRAIKWRKVAVTSAGTPSSRLIGLSF